MNHSNQIVELGIVSLVERKVAGNENLRICSLTSFWVYCFLGLGNNFESGSVPIPLLVPFGIFGHFTSMWHFMIDVGAPFSTPARECRKTCPQNLHAIDSAREALS